MSTMTDTDTDTDTQLLEHMIHRADSAEGAIRMFTHLARLAIEQYPDLARSKHIKGLLSVKPRQKPASVYPTSMSATNAPPGKKGKKTPIVELLLGQSKRSKKLIYNMEENGNAIHLLYDSLKERCDQYGYDGITFSGRKPGGQRLCFDPAVAQGGLTELLETLFSLGEEGKLGLIHRLESTLRLFVRWNPEMFPELDGVEMKGMKTKKAPGSSQSTLELLRDVDGLQPLPIDMAEHGLKYCSEIFNLVKGRISAQVSFADAFSATMTQDSGHCTHR